MILAVALVALTLQPDRPSSALERALAERACDVMTTAHGMSAMDHDKCVDDQLASLRADLGVNLARLTAGDRVKLDAACRALESAATREAYLDCVTRQLAPLRERLHKATPAAAAPEAAAADATSAPAAPPPAPAPPSRWRPIAIAGGAVLALAVAGGVIVMMKRRKSAAHVCRSCGTPVTDAGALCANCRHAAAEAVRRAAAERAAEAEEAKRREQKAAEAAAQLEQRQREAAQQAVLEAEARQRELEEAARQRELAARQTHAAAASAATASDEAFDPYATLGIAPDAGADAIRAAYEQARAKYDPENVSHLSPEVQQHYREKAEAVERAFQMLGAV
ncbi:MAG TPA: hypothetical protein VFA27_02960 [Vicinamibacterales bacterium]|nr:hypothetical protein [Vicinamibacterales bacterium]